MFFKQLFLCVAGLGILKYFLCGGKNLPNFELLFVLWLAEIIAKLCFDTACI